MVIVIPGSAPPTTPMSEPITSGTRYFRWSMPTRPAARSSNIRRGARTSEIHPAAARQQHVEVALEREIHHHRRDERHRQHAEIALRRGRRFEHGVGRCKIDERGDAKTEERK